MNRTARMFAVPLSVCLACLVGTALLMAQSVSARLEGRVMDSTQAVIPGVVVVATNEATNIATEDLTNESGRYIFPNLTPGTYTLSASLPGFKKTVSKGILLQIGDAKTQLGNQQDGLKTLISDHQDADMTEAIAEYQAAQTAYQAALAATSTVRQLSLVDYIRGG